MTILKRYQKEDKRMQKKQQNVNQDKSSRILFSLVIKHECVYR